LTKREIFKKRQFWLIIIVGLVVLSPFLIYMTSKFGNPLHSFISYFETSPFVKGYCDDPYPCGWGGYLTNTPGLFGWQLFPLFLIGFGVLLVNLFLSFDFIIKEKDQKYRWELFILIIIVIIFSFLATIMGNFEDRYMFMLMPLMFFITAQGVLFLYDKFKKYNKAIVVLCLIALFAWGAYLQVQQGSQIVEVKATSYIQIKEASFWMKENSLEQEILITQSRPFVAYYADREVKHVPGNESILLGYLDTIKPKYLMVSAYEKHPDWIYPWPQENPDKVELVQAWFVDQEQTQPIVLVYEFIYE
jgi:hypothetical protein